MLFKGVNETTDTTNDEEIMSVVENHESSNVFHITGTNMQQNVSSSTIIIVPLSEAQTSLLSLETNVSSLVPISVNLSPVTAMSPCSTLSLPDMNASSTSPSMSLVSSNSSTGIINSVATL